MSKSSILSKILNKLGYVNWRLKFYFFQFINNYFNDTVKRQRIDYKKIPIIIISFNNLNGLKKLIDFLRNRQITNIVIIDNDSNYQPLIEYYSQIENRIEIIFNKSNDGHMVFWKTEKILNKFKKGYYVVTDPDVLPNEDCPNNFMNYFMEKLDKNSKVSKVGFSLEIDDIPDTNYHKSKIINWESKYWEKMDVEGDFLADIDTTFALYRPINQFNIKYFYKAIRTKKPYSAKHLGWYIDHSQLTNEEVFFMETASKSSSWRVDEHGNLNS